MIAARAARGAAAVPAVLLVMASQAAAGDADRRLGERIARQGVNARGEPIRALVGQPPQAILGAPAACEACHTVGAPDSATQTGAATDLAWASLARAAQARGATAPYNEAALARAVTEGIAPAGGRLSPAMPRYSLSRSELSALVAFLQAPVAGNAASKKSKP